MSPCQQPVAADRLAEILGDALPALVGLEADVPKQPGIVELLIFAELFHRGRAAGCDRLDAVRIAAAELWTRLEVSETA